MQWSLNDLACSSVYLVQVAAPAKMFCYINKVQIDPPPPPSLKCFDIATNRATSLIIMDVFIEEIFECTKQGQ